MIKPIGGHAPQKRIPKNPKYENVKATVDSGFNALKQNEKLDETKANARFKREESFRRLKASAFSRLVDEAKLDYLLLDVRTREAYDECHIQGAQHYPANTLTRSVNVFNIDILNYMNKEPDRIILIYDDDEKIASPAGNLFFEKGVDNIFMLTGGLRELAAKYPELVDGTPPPPPSPSPSTTSTHSKMGCSSARSEASFKTSRSMSMRGMFTGMSTSDGGKAWR